MTARWRTRIKIDFAEGNTHNNLRKLREDTNPYEIRTQEKRKDESFSLAELRDVRRTKKKNFLSITSRLVRDNRKPSKGSLNKEHPQGSLLNRRPKKEEAGRLLVGACTPHFSRGKN